MSTEAFHTHSVEQSKGSVNPYVNFSDLTWYEFALPPLDEQCRIAGVLGAIEATCEKVHDASKYSLRLWNATATHHFSALFTDENRNTHLVELGKHLTYASDGPFGSKLKSEHYSDSGVRVIRLQNIDHRCFNDEDKAYIDEAYYLSDLESYSVFGNDVLIAGLGDDRIQPGRACLAPPSLGKAINKADCYCLRTTATLEPAFLVCFLNSSLGLRQSSAFAQGTTRYRLNLANIRKMKVPMPPLEVQHSLVDLLCDVEASGESLFVRYSESRKLKYRFLMRLFE
jgi:type I restriction enzyme, S subunit